MSIHKNEKTGKWDVHVWYRDEGGSRKRKHKRGFETKREASSWIEDFKIASSFEQEMTLAKFVEVYLSDIQPRVRLSTYLTKEYTIRNQVLPYLGKRKLSDITPRDVLRWQNKLIKKEVSPGKTYSETYLRTIHNQLSAIFNHACRFYGLKDSPVKKAGSMGKKNTESVTFWTQEEYSAFAKIAMRETLPYHAFEVLYWTGIRLGELLALTPEDIDFKKKTLRVTKSYQRIQKKRYCHCAQDP